MNISINFAKTAVLGAMLLVAFFASFVANAAVTLTSATFADDSVVETSDSVTVNVAATKDAAQCENNWNYTKITVTGPDSYEEVYTSTPFWGDAGTPGGSGKSSDTVTFNAPSVAGEYDVLVEIVGGGEIFGETDCDNSTFGIPSWPTKQTLDLTVYTPVAPSIEVTDISPKNVVVEVGASSTITYTATVVVRGVPTSAQLQCVVFDIFRGDTWQERVVTDANTNGTYYPSWTYTNVDTYSVGEYRVVAIASQEACGTFTSSPFNSSTFNAVGLIKETKLTIVEPEVPTFCVFGNVWGDANQNGSDTEGTPDGDESFMSGWTVTIGDVENVYDTTVTDESGNYELCAPAGEWIIKQVPPEGEEGWTYTYPVDGQWEIILPLKKMPIEVRGDVSFLDQVINFLVPTALAAVAPNNGPLNFGVFQQPANNGGGSNGGGNGRSVSLRDDSSSSSNNDDEQDEDAPEGEVLGESTSVVPVGAPDTGKGGASSRTSDLVLVALTTVGRTRKEEVA